MSIQDIITADRRQAILRTLYEAPGAQANEQVLRHGLDYLGHAVSHDLLRGDLEWLHEHQLVHREELTAALWLAKLTAAGADVATGRSHHPGVARPDPD